MNTSMKYIAVLLLAVAFAACKQNTPGLTDPTTNGSQTLSCLVDGKVWWPIFFSLTLPALTSTYGGDTLWVQAAKKREGTGTDWLSFECSGLHNSAGPTIQGVDFANVRGDFFHRAPGLQEIVITRLDTVQKIVSGRFTFTLADQTDTNIVHITDGRFDLGYSNP